MVVLIDQGTAELIVEDPLEPEEPELPAEPEEPELPAEPEEPELPAEPEEPDVPELPVEPVGASYTGRLVDAVEPSTTIKLSGSVK